MISENADVSPSAEIHASVTIWDLAQIRDFARIDANVGIGRGAYLGPGVRIGANTRVQNFALIYEPAEIAGGVLTGPSAVLTNDLRPRAINPDGSQKFSADWDAVGEPSFWTTIGIFKGPEFGLGVRNRELLIGRIQNYRMPEVFHSVNMQLDHCA